MDIKELEKHIIKLHDLGGIQVVPYDVVVAYVQKLHESYLKTIDNTIEEITTSFKDLVNTIAEDNN